MLLHGREWGRRRVEGGSDWVQEKRQGLDTPHPAHTQRCRQVQSTEPDDG